jgi:hypothetical protein
MSSARIWVPVGLLPSVNGISNKCQALSAINTCRKLVYQLAERWQSKLQALKSAFVRAYVELKTQQGSAHYTYPSYSVPGM